jgi:D-lactate dehydrogenase (cytochrome)
MVANNAAGTRTVKYGATKENVLALEVALADGRLIRTGNRAIKQSAGYNLTQLFVGSEGTLGVITEATLKLVPVPTIMSGVVANFEDVNAAVEAVVAVRGCGVDVAALEFLDEQTAGLATREEGVAWGEKPTLLMEIHAAHAETAELDIALMKEICMEVGAVRIEATTDTAERKKMWHTRYYIFETMIRVHPGEKWQLMDVAVPISAYPELALYTRKILEAQSLTGYIFGHAGDGNLHVSIPYPDEGTKQRAVAANAAVVEKAIALGGTSTGEHGVGIGKAIFMVREHGTAVDVMWQLKQTLDPNGILNPGKIFQNVQI